MIVRFLHCLVLALVISGCDQIRSGINDSINPPTAKQVAERVDQLVADGKYDDAIDKGRAYLAKHQDSDGVVDKALKEAYLRAGVSTKNGVEQAKTNDSATGYASTSKSVTSTTEIKYGQSTGSSAGQGQQVQSINAGGASVVQGPNGTVVRAGDAVVVMPK